MALAENASVKFSVSIFSLFRKSGEFKRVETRFQHNGATVRVNARIAAGSVVMRSKSDAALLMSAAYFDAKRFPTIRFVSDPISYAILDSGGKIQGQLSVRGKTLPQQFLVQANACAKLLRSAQSSRGNNVCVIELQGSLQRSDFGMVARRGIVSDKVELTLRVPLSRADEAR